MDGNVDIARVERGVEFARPQRLAADLGEGAVLNPVAGRGHRHDFKRPRIEPMRRDQRRDGQIRLRHRERRGARADTQRSEEHTSELQSLMRISYAVFCLKKNKNKYTKRSNTANYQL